MLHSPPFLSSLHQSLLFIYVEILVRIIIREIENLTLKFHLKNSIIARFIR